MAKFQGASANQVAAILSGIPVNHQKITKEQSIATSWSIAHKLDLLADDAQSSGDNTRAARLRKAALQHANNAVALAA